MTTSRHTTGGEMEWMPPWPSSSFSLSELLQADKPAFSKLLRGLAGLGIQSVEEHAANDENAGAGCGCSRTRSRGERRRAGRRSGLREAVASKWSEAAAGSKASTRPMPLATYITPFTMRGVVW